MMIIFMGNREGLEKKYVHYRKKDYTYTGSIFSKRDMFCCIVTKADSYFVLPNATCPQLSQIMEGNCAIVISTAITSSMISGYNAFGYNRFLQRNLHCAI